MPIDLMGNTLKYLQQNLQRLRLEQDSMPPSFADLPVCDVSFDLDLRAHRPANARHPPRVPG